MHTKFTGDWILLRVKAIYTIQTRAIKSKHDHKINFFVIIIVVTDIKPLTEVTECVQWFNISIIAGWLMQIGVFYAKKS